MSIMTGYRGKFLHKSVRMSRFLSPTGYTSMPMIPTGCFLPLRCVNCREPIRLPVLELCPFVEREMSLSPCLRSPYWLAVRHRLPSKDSSKKKYRFSIPTRARWAYILTSCREDRRGLSVSIAMLAFPNRSGRIGYCGIN